MIESILTSVKKCLNGIPECDESFDEDLLIFINSAFGTLYQLGVGPEKGYVITSKKDKWDDFIEDIRLQTLVKEYIVLKCKTEFCPPDSGFVMSSLQTSLTELTWRLRVFAEEIAEEGEPNVD